MSGWSDRKLQDFRFNTLSVLGPDFIITITNRRRRADLTNQYNNSFAKQKETDKESFQGQHKMTKR